MDVRVVKKAECQRIDAFELVVLEKTLENPRDGRAWWAAIYGVAQSWT